MDCIQCGVGTCGAAEVEVSAESDVSPASCIMGDTTGDSTPSQGVFVDGGTWDLLVQVAGVSMVLSGGGDCINALGDRVEVICVEGRGSVPRGTNTGDVTESPS